MKQGAQRDELMSSGPHGMTASFSHSFPHSIHLTRSLFIAWTLLKGSLFYLVMKYPQQGVPNTLDMKSEDTGEQQKRRSHLFTDVAHLFLYLLGTGSLFPLWHIYADGVGRQIHLNGSSVFLYNGLNEKQRQ
jgi:hypothetical protein